MHLAVLGVAIGITPHGPVSFAQGISMASADDHRGVILVDDGEYFVIHHDGSALIAATGFLVRRHRTASSETLQYLGGYHCQMDGVWIASMEAARGKKIGIGERTILGSFDHRLEAIYALWRHRHDAARQRRS